MRQILFGLSSIPLGLWTHYIAVPTAIVPSTSNVPIPPQQVPQASTQLVSLETAAVAAVGAVLGVVLKDLIFKLWDEHRAKRETLRAVYARYADPLSLATVSLLWRL